MPKFNSAGSPRAARAGVSRTGASTPAGVAGAPMEAALDGGSDGLGSPAPGMTMAEAASTSLPGVGEPPPDVGGVSYDALGHAGLAPGVLGGAPGLLGGAPGLLGAPPHGGGAAPGLGAPCLDYGHGHAAESLAAAAAAAYPLHAFASLGALPYGAVGGAGGHLAAYAPVVGDVRGAPYGAPYPHGLDASALAQYQAAQALAQASSYGGGDAKLGAKARAAYARSGARDPARDAGARAATSPRRVSNRVDARCSVLWNGLAESPRSIQKKEPRRLRRDRDGEVRRGAGPVRAIGRSRRRLNPNMRHGRWSEEEHKQFLDLMTKYGRSWTRISQVMMTRTEPQVRSHAQKHFLRVNRQSKAAEAARPGGADGDDGGLAADGDALDGEGKPRREPAPNATAGLGGPDQT